MQLHRVPDSQLSEILKCVKSEIYRRKKENKLTPDKVKTFEEKYPDELPPTQLQSISPATLKSLPKRKLRYLMPLLKQDWQYLFPSQNQEKKFYVYAHCDPLRECISMPAEYGGIIRMPFYIGKGTGNRAFDLQRNQGHGAKLRELVKKGVGVDEIVIIIKGELSESEALSLESKLIYFFGTIYQNPKSGVLLNLDIPPTPLFNGRIVQTPKEEKLLKQRERIQLKEARKIRKAEKRAKRKQEALCKGIEIIHDFGGVK